MTDRPPGGFDPSGLRPETRLIHEAEARSPFSETAEAIYMTSGYVYDTAEDAEAAFDGSRPRYVYSRFRNPTVKSFEQRLAALEGVAECRATASGMAAVFAAVMSQLAAGDRVVASRALFGSCHWIVAELLPKIGFETELVDGTDMNQWEKALSRPARVVLLESPSNPTLELIDIAAVADLTHKAGGKLIVDNVFAGPILQNCFRLGADVTVYSATKHIDGQGRTLGGAILTDDVALMEDAIALFMRHTGPSLSPFNAWVLLKGLETLPMRTERHCANAAMVAEALRDHPKIETLIYPGLADHPQHTLAKRQMTRPGPLLAFRVKGGKAAAFETLNRLNLIKISNNLGDAKSLACHPATTTHQRLSPEDRAHLGIADGLIRLSVGLEAPEDILADLERALG